MKGLAGDLLRLIFPSTCILCRGPRVRGEPLLCSICLLRLPRERNYQGTDNNTTNRLRGMLDFKGAYSFLRFSKDNSVQSIIHHIKYRGSKQLAFQLGVWFASEVLFSIKDQVDTIVPVPLHAHKLKQRGYNQSAEIAFGISRVTGHPVSLWLQRNGKTETQTKLGRWERFENTAHEFRLRDQMCLANTRILLLDDIITTGATMTGTSVPLYRAGARNLTLAAVGLTQHI